MTRKQIIKLVTAEVRRAKRLHPGWPKGSFFLSNANARVIEAAVVAEEAFEALQVALNMRPEDPHHRTTTVKDYKKELVQNAAMCFRALEVME